MRRATLVGVGLLMVAGLGPGCGDRSPPAVWPRPAPPSLARPLPDADASTDEGDAGPGSLHEPRPKPDPKTDPALDPKPAADGPERHEAAAGERSGEGQPRPSPQDRPEGEALESTGPTR